MYKFKLIQKLNPNDRSVPKKWYATSIGEKAQSVKAMTRAATENTTTAPTEMEAVFDLFSKYAVQQLQQGHLLKMGNLGTLRISFKSEGVADIDAFNAATMIKNPRVVFIPSKEFREAILSGLQFQNGGVVENGISYSSVVDYKRAKGITTDQTGGSSSDEGGGSTGGSSGESGGQDVNPLS